MTVAYVCTSSWSLRDETVERRELSQQPQSEAMIKDVVAASVYESDRGGAKID